MASLYTSRTTYWGALAVTTVVLVPSIRRALYPAYTNSKEDATGKVIILTGATGKIGSSAALELAKRNCRLIMACRNIDKCKALRRELVLLTNNKSITCRRLNLEDMESMNDFVDDVLSKEPHIDAIVNAAGVKDIPEKELTKYGIEKHFWINFLAPYFLIMRFLEKLKERAKETGDTRVVNIIGRPKKKCSLDPSDINFDRRRYSGKEAYWQSKQALAYFTILLNKFNHRDGLRAYGVSIPDAVIKPPFDHKQSFEASIMGFLGLWFSYEALNMCTGLLLGSIDKKVTNNCKSGGELFSYFSKSWGRNQGWGKLADQELDAQFTWNLGAKMLLELSTKRQNNGQFEDETTSQRINS